MARNLLVITFLAFLAYTLASPMIDVRIAGGFDAMPNQFPYQVAIYAHVPEYHEALADDFCSGSLISRNYVLTAASCLAKAQHLTVVLGSQQLDVFDSAAVKTHPSKVIIPEGYTSGNYEWDIALIKLSEPVELSDKIKTIQLAEGSEDFAGDAVTVAGWGATQGAQDTVEPVLKWVKTIVVSYRQCVKDNYWYEQTFAKESHICTNTGLFAPSFSPCRGDKGAPLTWNGVQIGLVSYTPGCFKGYPAVYTKVSHYIDWIRENSDI